MNTKKLDFDKLAGSWDEDPGRVQLAEDVAGAISREIPLSSDMDVMDFGCGTGLLTLQLRSKVRFITSVDSSEGMLAVLEGKIARQNLTNVRTIFCDLDQGNFLPGNYQLVVSSMTLHHIREIEPLFKQFYEIITPSGHLCVADLDLDGGQFHASDEGVFHHGFDRSYLHRLLREVGFSDVRDITAAEVTKQAADGNMRTFSVFLISGRK